MVNLFDDLSGHRDGVTYEPAFDFSRLNRQAKLVALVMVDREWHTLRELSEQTGQPEASISARLRDLRKARFGSHTIERRRVSRGLFSYRLGQRGMGK